MEELPRGGDPESATQQSRVALKPTGISYIRDDGSSSCPGADGTEVKGGSSQTVSGQSEKYIVYKCIWKLLNV